MIKISSEFLLSFLRFRYILLCSLDIRANYYIHAHNAKMTLKYHLIMGDIREAVIVIRDDALPQFIFQLLHFFITNEMTKQDNYGFFIFLKINLNV